VMKLLSALGRATIAAAAAVIVAGFVIGGYMAPVTHPGAADYKIGQELGAAIGFVVGLIAAGMVLGPVATLYDIRDQLRRLVERESGGPMPARQAAGELSGPASVRREPRLN